MLEIDLMCQAIKTNISQKIHLDFSKAKLFIKDSNFPNSSYLEK